MKKRTRGLGKKPRSDAKHDVAELAAHEDSRRRHGERQKGVARQLGVDPRRMRDALHRALHDDDPGPLQRILGARLDEYDHADHIAKTRALAVFQADPYSLGQQGFEQLLQSYRDEERKARGLQTDKQQVETAGADDEQVRRALLKRLLDLLSARVK